MKTKQTLLTAMDSDATTVNNKDFLTKNNLRHFIRLALAGSVLASGVAVAALQDFGGIADNSGTGLTPAILNWPAWYRDNNSLSLGLCKSQAPSPNAGAAGAPMCFPIDSNPAGYAGNVGDEIFYTNLNANITNGGIDLRYVTALEAAYASTAPTKGQEIVFTRVRFVMGVTGAACLGDYRIIHPWGDQTFTVNQEGARALFETLDIPAGAILDFAGAANNGSIGPFLQWDDGAEFPLLRTAANGLAVPSTTPSGPVTEEFVGDPSVPHTYTGSPFIERNTDGTPKYLIPGTALPQHQNYLKVIAPTGCNIGGTPAPTGEGTNVNRTTLGLLMGQVWTAPIATATQVPQATFTRTNQATIVDVWAKTAPNQQLFVTGTNLQGVQMTPVVIDGGVATGNYQAHMVLGGNAVLPDFIHVVNSSSNPVVSVAASLSDIVHISKAEYNPADERLCVVANSSDDLPITLTVDSSPVSYTLTPGSKSANCSAPGAHDQSIYEVFPNNNRSPNKVRVISGLAGASEKLVTVLANTPDNTVKLVANPDAFTNIPSSGAQLDVGLNDGAGGTGFRTGEIVIVDQPNIPTVDANGQPTTQIVGKVTGSLTGGTATFTGNPGAAGKATFSYVIKSGQNVSNLVNATIDITFVATPPTGSPDNFAVLKNTGTSTNSFTANVLINDIAAVGTTINNDSIVISTQGAKGVATVANGKVTYKPTAGAAIGADAFFYTVANSAGTVSAPIRVDVVVENAAEALAFQRVRMTKQNTGLKWDIRFSTSWFGAPLTTTGTCYLTKVGSTTYPISETQRIGSVLADATGLFQLQATSTVPSRQTFTISCNTSNSTGSILFSGTAP